MAEQLNALFSNQEYPLHSAVAKERAKANAMHLQEQLDVAQFGLFEDDQYEQ